MDPNKTTAGELSLQMNTGIGYGGTTPAPWSPLVLGSNGTTITRLDYEKQIESLSKTIDTLVETQNQSNYGLVEDEIQAVIAKLCAHIKWLVDQQQEARNAS